MGQEQVAIKFEAAWSVFARTCGHFWAPEASFQAWLAHYLISQFGIDRVAREPIININGFPDSELKAKVGGGEVRPDAVVTRHPGIVMPHYANRIGRASDESGLGLLKELAVISDSGDEVKDYCESAAGGRITVLHESAASRPQLTEDGLITR